MTMMCVTLSVMTASISASSRVSPSLQTAAERKGTYKIVVKTATNEIEIGTSIKTKKMRRRMTLAPPSTSRALVSSSSPRLGIRPPQQWLL